MSKCTHLWGPTLYSPIFTGRTFCFSPPEHYDRWVRYCKRCSYVEEFVPSLLNEWRQAKGLLTPWEQRICTWDREEEIRQGAVEERSERTKK